MQASTTMGRTPQRQAGRSRLLAVSAALIMALAALLLTLALSSSMEPSNAAVAGELVARYDKAGTAGGPALDHIDYGAIALRREVVAELPPGERRGLDETQAALAARGRLRAHLASDRFFEVGSEAGLADLEAELERRARSTSRTSRGELS